MDQKSCDQLAGVDKPRKALLLDRDGVINVDHGYVFTQDSTEWVPGIFDLCRKAHDQGFLIVVVTNQAGIARGYYTESQFLAYTRWMHQQFTSREVPLLATYYCPHHPDAGTGSLRVDCGCRKPKPGMILAAASDLELDLRNSILIGDKSTDIAAAKAAGVGKTILLDGRDRNMGNAADALV